MTGSASQTDARFGAGLVALDVEVARALSILARDGAGQINPPALLSAETLLDLYGEDIRNRAYIASDAGGEAMLRPDFTVPVVEAHLARGGGAARYVYSGPVWRRQTPGGNRAREYMQVGLEVFGDHGPEAEADVFARFQRLVSGARVRAEIGDIDLLRQAVESLGTTSERTQALLRHLWRPTRFARMLDRFSTGHADFIAAKADLVAARAAGQLDARMDAAGAEIGLRNREDVANRVARLAQEADTPPIDATAVTRIRELLALEGPADQVLSRLRVLSQGAPRFARAVDTYARRLAAFKGHGIGLSQITFKGSYGRTSLEYYDGFVFGFVAPDRPDLPVIASGGRFDALIKAMGGAEDACAVGGILRPETLLATQDPPT